jgi:LmbE family N-acetylglucosaminyl deacetylase
MRPAIWLLLLCAPVWAQRELSGAAKIYLSLKGLANTSSALMVAAHPDDENNALLAWLARGRGARTGYLSLTRGEGGQNLIGPEQGVELGVLRTQELLAARRIDGAEQYFTSAADFGFSKTAAETLRIWGREKIRAEVMEILKEFRPDIVILRFSGTPADGHGHHQASAMLAKEAVEALAQQGGWRVKRVFHNLFGSPAGREAIAIEAGEFDPVLGFSYAEIGGMSRSVHRSQGFGAAERKGAAPVHLAVVWGEKARSDPFEGIDTTWNRVAGGAEVAKLLAQAAERFRPERPQDLLPLLVRARAIAARLQDPIARRKLAEFDETIALCAGLWLDAAAERWAEARGRPLKVSLTAVERLEAGAELLGVSVAGIEAAGDVVRLESNRPQVRTVTVNMQEGLGAVFRLRIHGAEIAVRRPVRYRWVDPARGELTRDVVVVPPVAVAVPEAPLVFAEATPRKLEVRLTANVAGAGGEVRLEAPPGWSVEPKLHPFRIEAAGETVAAPFLLRPPAGESRGAALAVARVNGENVSRGMKVIDYPHILPQALFPESRVGLVRADIRTLATKVGYVMGSGDEVPAALEQIGCSVTLLSDEALKTGDLSRFDAIITGVRAYDVRPALRAARNRLLAYMSGGGTLLVQYNKLDSERGRTSDFPWGPLPFQINRARVSEEDAPVRILDRGSPLVKRPNAITERDFEGWVQERGLYFASRWDPGLRPLFSTQDTGEAPLEGGTLYTAVGKGAFVFTAFSWFRQLPAGAPGAYRVFANLMSAGKVLGHESSH